MRPHLTSAEFKKAYSVEFKDLFLLDGKMVNSQSITLIQNLPIQNDSSFTFREKQIQVIICNLKKKYRLEAIVREMFYSKDLLGKRSPMGAVWIAAHGKKLKKARIMAVNVRETW